MATLSSSSTDTEIWQAYDDNASFEEDSSVAKGKVFITACQILLRRQPVRVTTDGLSVDFNAAFIQSELSRARRFVSANKRGGSVRHLSTRLQRD